MPSSYPYSSGGKYGIRSKYGTSSISHSCDYDDLDSAYGSSSKTSSLYGGSSFKYAGSEFDTDYDYKSSGYKSRYGAMPYDDETTSRSSKSSYGRTDSRPDYERTADYDPVEVTEYDDSRIGGYSTNSNATLRRPATARGISPPCSDAERPRRQHSYSDHRSVSPLGSSRFENRSDYSSRPLGRSSTVRETPSYGDDGYYGKSDTTSGYKGAGLSRSNAVRGRGLSATNARGFGSSTGYSSSSRSGSSAKKYGTDYDLY
ncbi:hypothetical protein HBI56_053880 [Parastagonospora nodorum]|uniref:Uncharacterized protein n=2 Tax=Phaeosphaeria nodorum (strain SN15 / ATCC MYA-4574 / FGSC 10173) TaxID=321614 RepID=A0A7U2ICL6_PHANO|nr:hypothetical protein SNOG_13246 [Parastagonospora nodorum SN15]KAH3914061.1 hypothetical protein HBH56_098200 [Parastagonospora nodorum]EAT79573.1 hypothetical protein SNOG_13246 [Parastagonospora nodorum SN15]KAH3930267.1 hypothetical protein HBH54_112520 [Parastagonospora nodorum]KAH3938990.1 hypothetical protein HBH53_242150 [Parastagonospora nodorum]KAH3964512.1 hypothetical protein HBH51_159500 [Parastagonospora nodorum]